MSRSAGRGDSQPSDSAVADAEVAWRSGGSGSGTGGGAHNVPGALRDPSELCRHASEKVVGATFDQAAGQVLVTVQHDGVTTYDLEQRQVGSIPLGSRSALEFQTASVQHTIPGKGSVAASVVHDKSAKGYTLFLQESAWSNGHATAVHGLDAGQPGAATAAGGPLRPVNFPLCEAVGANGASSSSRPRVLCAAVDGRQFVVLDLESGAAQSRICYSLHDAQYGCPLDSGSVDVDAPLLSLDPESCAMVGAAVRPDGAAVVRLGGAVHVLTLRPPQPVSLLSLVARLEVLAAAAATAQYGLLPRLCTCLDDVEPGALVAALAAVLAPTTKATVAARKQHYDALRASAEARVAEAELAACGGSSLGGVAGAAGAGGGRTAGVLRQVGYPRYYPAVPTHTAFVGGSGGSSSGNTVRGVPGDLGTGAAGTCAGAADK
eukprot:XP_001703379.1 predicted protein [Chlamydomonas reinhardtii]